ncbi:MAG: S9 family peptidase [Candidatus Poribacteria bacterium]
MKGKILTIEHLLNIQRLTDRAPLHLSPDGRWLALSVQGVRKDATGVIKHGFQADGVNWMMAGSRILVVDTSTGEAQEPFPAGSVSWGAQWSPDGSRLAAYLQHEGAACVGIWSLEQDTYQLLRQATVRVSFGFEVPQWTPDSRTVVVKLWPASGSVKYPSKEDLSSPDDTSVTVFSFDPTDGEKTNRPSGAWLFDGALCDLGYVDVITGDVRRLVSDWSFRGWRIAPDGRAVAALKMSEYNQEEYQLYYDLVIVPINGASPKTIATGVWRAYGIGFNWSPDSRYIAYTTGDEDRIRHGQLFIVPADGSKKPNDLTGGEKFYMNEYAGPRWSADGNFIYCLTYDGIWEFSADGNTRRKITTSLKRRVSFWIQPPTGITLWTPDGESILAVTRNSATKNEALVRVDLKSGEATTLIEFAQWCLDNTFETEAASDGSACYLVTEAADHPPEIWVAGGNFSAPHRLYSLNPELDDVALGKARLIEWRAPDGKIRRGALLLPLTYAEGQRLPVIFQVYGGSFDSGLLHEFGLGWGIVNNHLLASRGYAVLCPDLPMEDRDPMRQLPGLLLPAVNRLIDLGIADPNRLGLMGHSYGGYCVLALLTQTDCFRAAICSAGMVNFTSAYGGLTDDGDSSWGYFEVGQGGMGGTLWERRSSYIENSPLFYLDRVCTPLLLVCGAEDRGATSQAKEAFSALRRLGQKVELRLYHGEGHWPGNWTEDSLRDLCSRVIDWFETYLKA